MTVEEDVMNGVARDGSRSYRLLSPTKLPVERGQKTAVLGARLDKFVKARPHELLAS